MHRRANRAIPFYLLFSPIIPFCLLRTHVSEKVKVFTVCLWLWWCTVDFYLPSRSNFHFRPIDSSFVCHCIASTILSKFPLLLSSRKIPFSFFVPIHHALGYILSHFAQFRCLHILSTQSAAPVLDVYIGSTYIGSDPPGPLCTEQSESRTKHFFGRSFALFSSLAYCLGLGLAAV